MLSVANVRTAGGAANYFAADNYYTRGDAERSGQWLGKGAETLGIAGRKQGPIDARDCRAFADLERGKVHDPSAAMHAAVLQVIINRRFAPKTPAPISERGTAAGPESGLR